jgi:hypothetical protein
VTTVKALGYSHYFESRQEEIVVEVANEILRGENFRGYWAVESHP